MSRAVGDTSIRVTDAAVRKIPTRWFDWWPLLLGVGAFLWVTVAHWTGQEYLHRKEYLEVIALGLAITASVVAFVRVVKTDEPYRLLLFAVTLCVFCRECHWEWTTQAVYVGLGMVAIWGLIWLKKLSPYTDANPKVRVWLISTAVMYVVSQLVARRTMQHLSIEGSSFYLFADQIYDTLEEMLEDTAHAMLIVTTLVGWRGSRNAEEPGSAESVSAGEDAEKDSSHD